ncbi:hypothetical protein [Streptomyces sp. LKA04]|uniref:hypothetical protein n=1 Tax=Streptomyces sp. LKA04 TaxID=3398092 RepID=UPI003A80261C
MPNKNAAKATAVARLVECEKKERAGENVGDFYRTKVQPAVNAAMQAGCPLGEIHAEADRTYGRWLIDNAGK